MTTRKKNPVPTPIISFRRSDELATQWMSGNHAHVKAEILKIAPKATAVAMGIAVHSALDSFKREYAQAFLKYMVGV